MPRGRAFLRWRRMALRCRSRSAPGLRIYRTILCPISGTIAIQPYWFDDNEQCWPAGATDLWVQGHGFAFTSGQALLIQTDLPGESLRQIVQLTAAGSETVDPIFLTDGSPTPVTHLVWGSGDALTRARDLTNTVIGGNLLPATQGQRFTETFAIGARPPSAPDATLAIARRGPNGSDSEPNYVFRYPLGQTPLGWLANADPTQPPSPEIILRQTLPTAATWSFAISLLESLATDSDFTIDPVAWQVVARSDTGQPTQYDIIGDNGGSIRFGNDVFGASPADQDLFQVTYRTGLGAIGNVAADSITMIDPIDGRPDHRRRATHSRSPTEPTRRPRATSSAWRRRPSERRSTAPCSPRTMRRRRNPCLGCRKPAPRFAGPAVG